MTKRILALLGIGSLLVLAGCNEEQGTTANVTTTTQAPPQTNPVERWYTTEQIAQGDTLFQANCASCHKPDASGTPNWRKADAQGKYPPPPLNGAAHTWRHPLDMLPMGSPGMEEPRKGAYDVLTFRAGGKIAVYAKR
jgi:hypothetical protein